MKGPHSLPPQIESQTLFLTPLCILLENIIANMSKSVLVSILQDESQKPGHSGVLADALPTGCMCLYPYVSIFSLYLYQYHLYVISSISTSTSLYLCIIYIYSYLDFQGIDSCSHGVCQVRNLQGRPAGWPFQRELML